MFIAMSYTANESVEDNRVGTSEESTQGNKLLKNNEITLSSLIPNESFFFRGIEYYIDDIEIPVELFTDKAEYTYNGLQESLPSSSIFEKEYEREIVAVFKNGMQETRTILILDKMTQENIELSRIGKSRIFTTIQDKDIDYESLNNKFRYGEIQNFPTNYHRNTNKQIRNATIFSCTSYRIINLAVAYDSSFCIEYHGKDGANDRVQKIILAVSKRYEQPGLCMKVKISHLEANCIPEEDPYKPYVNLNKSGCSSYGLVHYVRDMWEAGKSGIIYDAMHLFIGTNLECEESGCIIGCAFNNEICSKNRYGVDHITFSSSLNLQVVLVSHELAHICGAYHYPRSGYIMHQKIGNGTLGFSPTSISLMNNFIDAASCIEEYPVPSYVPKAISSSIPTNLLSSKPTLLPSVQSSSLPSFMPSLTLSPSLSELPSNTPSLSSRPSWTPSTFPIPIPSISLSPSLSPSVFPSLASSLLPSSKLSSPIRLLSYKPSNSPYMYSSLKPSALQSFQSSLPISILQFLNFSTCQLSQFYKFYLRFKRFIL